MGLKPNGQPNKAFFGAIIGGALLVILIISVIVSSGGGTSPGLVKIAQQQTELARVAAIDYESLNSDEVQALAINTQLTMLSTNADFLSFLGANGIGISSDQIALGVNPATDTELETAKVNGALDEAMHQALVAQLTEYKVTLNTVYQNASPAMRQRLLELGQQATLLIKQSEQ